MKRKAPQRLGIRMDSHNTVATNLLVGLCDCHFLAANAESISANRYFEAQAIAGSAVELCPHIRRALDDFHEA